MAKGIFRNLIIGIIAIAAIVLFIFFMYHIQTRFQAKFDRLLASFKEGMSFSEVEQKLGEPGRTLTEPRDVKEWGTIADTNIIQECNLHMFLRMDVIPHRFILIYEDKKTHEVRRITWKGT